MASVWAGSLSSLAVFSLYLLTRDAASSICSFRNHPHSISVRLDASAASPEPESHLALLTHSSLQVLARVAAAERHAKPTHAAPRARAAPAATG